MSSNGNSEKKYPISEIFTSPQGEGLYTGTMMTFVRLAGCTVGKPYPKQDYLPKEEMTFVGLEDMPPKFHIYTEKCTLYDGREFPCDTDYRVKSRLTAEEIESHINPDVDRVCITGGEPCMHDIMSLLQYLARNGKRKIHLETSGTINWELQPVWITVSPKKGVTNYMLDRADELKLLVDEKFDPRELIPDSLTLPLTIAKQKPVYLQPVNYENTLNGDNVDRCVYWQNKYPQFRISLQLHKVLSQYTKEMVR